LLSIGDCDLKPHGLQGIYPDILLGMRIGCRHIGKMSLPVLSKVLALGGLQGISGFLFLFRT
jgi:hypothetical protein